MTTEPKIYFATFADKKMLASRQRLEMQAREFGLFSKLFLNDETTLDEDFQEAFGRYLKPHIRGFGYWSWKPQVILQALRQIEDNDMLLYMDSGSHLNKNGLKRFNDYLELAKQGRIPILAFSGGQTEKTYTKHDLFVHLGLDEEQYTDTNQIYANFILIQRTPEAIKFIEEWLAIFCQDIKLITDTPSHHPNYPEFIDHRHDQSIFSLLGKKYGIKTIPDESYIDHNKWELLHDKPIHAKRDKGSKDKSWRFRIKRKCTNFFIRKLGILP